MGIAKLLGSNAATVADFRTAVLTTGICGFVRLLFSDVTKIRGPFR